MNEINDNDSTGFVFVHQEFLRLCNVLSNSEFSVYLWLKTKYPSSQDAEPINTEKISKDLKISRRTVQRALVVLRERNLVTETNHKFNLLIHVR